MKKDMFLFLAGLFFFKTTNAQFRTRPQYRRPVQPAYRQPGYKPALSLAFGYDYPNLDKHCLLDFYQYNQGTVTQKGPVSGSLDYRFNRHTSIGAMVSYGKVQAPYYAFNFATSAAPDFTAYLTNWTAMLNLIRYMPGSSAVSPYLRTAVGVNIWNQNYLDKNGSKFLGSVPNAAVMAYQASLGIKSHFSQHAGAFVEAGYGKYIVSGGLTFKLN